MRIMAGTFASLLVIITFGESFGTSVSVERYHLYKDLEQALVNGNTSLVPNLQILADVFFPKQSQEPLCAPIKYLIFCNDTLTSDEELEGLEEDPTYSFIWTHNFMSPTTTTLLSSFSKSGITLRGFEWEKSCIFMNETELMLQLDPLVCLNEVDIISSLGDLTSQLKSFADAQDIPEINNKFRGHSLNWNNSKKHFHYSNIMFTVYIVILNIFIFCSSLGSSNHFYQKLYKNIEGRKNPGYSLFWAIVVLSIAWNVAPSWLVLSKCDYKIYFSLAVVVPLQLVVTLLIKKKSTFPIPGLVNSNHSLSCVDDVHSISRAIFSCILCVRNHIIQVLSFWSLYVTYTFVIHYMTSIILALYLDPLNSLIKILFIKAVAVCFIVNVALLFAVDVFTCGCTVNALKKNFGSIVSIITVVSFFPILVFVCFMIGGIVFTELPENNSWKAIFTLVPSALLLYASWFSHGILFPKGIKDPQHPINEITRDLEGDATHSIQHDTESANGAHTQISTGEDTPLIAHPHDEEEFDGVHSRLAPKSKV